MKFSYDLKSKKLSSWKKPLPVVLGVVVLSILVGLLSLGWWYQLSLRPVSDVYSEQVTVIVSGSSTTEIARQLDDEGLVRNAKAFDWHVDNFGTNQHLQAGTFRLSPSFSSQKIAQILFEGRVETSLVTIPSGLRLDEVAKSLVESGFSAAEVETALAAKYTHSIFRDKPPSASLEGYVFPETYQTTDASTARSVVEHSFDVFYAQLSNEIMVGISRQGLNLHEAITLASIVQEEVPDAATKRQVAQVFLKRLEIGMPLGADPTFRYAAAMEGRPPTVDFDSPYNTRLHTGLPPGPISNFDITALEAVANPASGDYLFFVSGDDGRTFFSRTLAEHEAYAAKYCIENCRL